MFINAFLLTACALPTFGTAFSVPLVVQRPWESDRVADDIKVPVVLGVMSRCPDALLCESVFDQVLKKTSNKVDFSLTYIAQYGDHCLPELSILM